MRASLLISLALFFWVESACASNLVVEFFGSDNESAPFKEVRCVGLSCNENGLLPVGGISIPVSFSVRVDDSGKLFIDDIVRGDSIHYGAKCEEGKYFLADGVVRRGVLYRNRQREGQSGLSNDLVMRSTYDIRDIWVKAYIDP